MIGIALIVTASLIAGLGVLVFAAARAPQGYQDETGFHFGPDTHEPAEELQRTMSGLSR